LLDLHCHHQVEKIETRFRGTTMDLNRFTTKAQQAVVGAQRLAESYNHSELEPLHLLLALLQQADGVAPQVISKIGARLPGVIGDVQSALAAKPKVYGSAAQIGLSRAAVDVLNRAEAEAGKMRDDYISTEHILLALTQERTTGDLLARHD